MRRPLYLHPVIGKFILFLAVILAAAVPLALFVSRAWADSIGLGGTCAAVLWLLVKFARDRRRAIWRLR